MGSPPLFRGLDATQRFPLESCAKELANTKLSALAQPVRPSGQLFQTDSSWIVTLLSLPLSQDGCRAFAANRPYRQLWFGSIFR